MSVDVFQIYSGSADAAPGKGAGETLMSPPATYASLRKIVNWRRELAAGNKLDEILPLTGTAQIWEAPLKKPKVHRKDLEEKRDQLKVKQVSSEKSDQMEQMDEQVPEVAQAPPPSKAAPAPAKTSRASELLAKKAAAKAAAASGVSAPMGAQQQALPPPLLAQAEVEDEDEVAFAPPPAAAPEAKPKPTKKTKKTTSKPENILAEAQAPQAPVEIVRPDMEKEEKTSTIRFCPICRYYLYNQVTPITDKDASKSMNHFRLCRNCGYKEQDEKGGLLSEILVQEKSAEGYKILLNEFTRRDPRLPHLRGVLKCPDPGCESNHGGKESDIIYMKYDSTNLMYLYICDICGFEWRSRR